MLPIDSVLINVISNGISFLLGYLLPKSWHILKNRNQFRALKNFWLGIEGEVLLVTCMHVAEVPDGEESNPKYLGFGDASAMKHIVEFLSMKLMSKDPIHIRSYFEGKLLPEDRDNNIICIGGGKTNQVTTGILYDIHAPRHFFDRVGENQLEESKVVRDSKNNWNVKPVVVNGNVIEDVGIIIKSKHPSYRHRTVIILAGAYSYGTLAAAKFATSEALLRQYEHIINSEQFEIVLKAKVDGFNVCEIEVEWASKF